MDQELLKRDCCLCGICAAICPVNAITYDPGLVIDGNKCIDCSKCVEVCIGRKFGDLTYSLGNQNKNFDFNIGSFDSLNAITFKDESTRKEGTSSAFVRGFSRFLIDSKEVDAVIDMHSATKLPHLIDRKNKRSCYFLFPLLEELKNLEESKRYAIVALPCQIRALKKAQDMGFFQNITFSIGLFCGFNMEYSMLGDMVKSLSLNEEDLESVDYRGGPFPGGLTLNFKNARSLSFKKKLYKVLNLFYLPNRCFYCSDFTAEAADISVGDIWGNFLDKDISDRWNSVVTRTNRSEQILNKFKTVSFLVKVDLKQSDLLKSFSLNFDYKKNWVALRIKKLKKDYVYTKLGQNDIKVKHHLMYFLMSFFRTNFVRKFFWYVFPLLKNYFLQKDKHV